MPTGTEQERCLQAIEGHLKRIADTLDVLALPIRRYFQMEAIVESYKQERAAKVPEGFAQARKEKG